MKLAHFISRIATLLVCLEQRKPRHSHRRKVYVNNFASHVSEVVSHVIEKVHRFERI